MEKVKLSLNPRAAIYVPLSKKESKDENKNSETTLPPEGHSGIGWNYLYTDDLFNSGVHDMEGHRIGEEFTKDQQNPSKRPEKHIMDESSEIDLEYLTFMFPNISQEFLAHAYYVNGGDLEASIDMLDQLEDYPDDVSKHLPDNLNIGDAKEDKVSPEGTSVELKSTLSGEASGS